ncbi:sugar ABC transporter ATP-binding protein [Nonomuraea lactucae]|uniref:sugar ABC transporter ATP-binding protein n=1 Tax=Nonomuraea lactucae TaxID=2249762 RepID=UPI000DE3FA9A|nr:sugar ABC transporter ATP-binding protein [Nonomuraea lactucae]
MNVVRVEIQGVSKDFAGQRALDRVSLSIREGEVHALLGANGSGKSTLIKVLAGVHRPEAGSVVNVRGERLEFGSARASHAAGFRFIHQDLGLVDELDIAENLLLGATASRRFWLSSRREWDSAATALRKHGVNLDPRRLVAGLPPSEKSMVAIVRAVEDGLHGGGILVLDEPTAALPPDEVRHLMDLVRRLSDRGVSIVYVTHRLHEVFEIADTVTVLRDGAVIGTEPIDEVRGDRLLEMILGRTLEPYQAADPSLRGEPVLEVDGLTAEGIDDASFTVHAGEVLGLTGLIGSGHESILGATFGAVPGSTGTVRVSGRPLLRAGPKRALAAGIAYAPADRRTRGALTDWTVRENLTLPNLKPRGLARRLSTRWESVDTAHWLRRLQVKPGDPEARFASLSGGNQQKVVIARWLRCLPKVFLLDEPTIGVDAGAKLGIYRELRNAADAGAGVVIASSDAEELAAVCSRVLIFGGGRVVEERSTPLSPDSIVAACMRAAAPSVSPGERVTATTSERHQRT